MLRLVFTLVVNAIALLLASWALPGFDLGGKRQALGLALVLGLVMALLGPFLTRIALPVTVLTLGLGGLLLTGGLVWSPPSSTAAGCTSTASGRASASRSSSR